MRKPRSRQRLWHRTDAVPTGRPSALCRHRTAVPAAAVLTILALALSAEGLRAQDEQSRRVGLSWGVGHLMHQDLVHTPFVHGGAFPTSFGIHYDREGTWHRFFEGSYGALTSRLMAPYPIEYHDHQHDAVPHVYVLVDAAYGLGRPLGAGPLEGVVLGAALRIDAQAVAYGYGLDDNFGYLLSPGLNLWIQRQQTLSDRQKVRARAMAPVVSWVARSPYLVNDDQFIENISSGRPLEIALAFLGDGGFATWDRLQRLNAAVDYRFAVSRRVEVGATYRLDVVRTLDPRPLASLRSHIGLTTSLRF